MICTILENQLIKFRETYTSTSVNVHEDYLMYVFAMFSNAKKQCDEANRIIEKLELDLVAIHAGRNSFFIVKSNEAEAI